MTRAGSYNWPATGIVYIKMIEQKLTHVLSNEVAKGSSSWKTGRGWKFPDIVPELSNTIKVRVLKSASFTCRSFKVIRLFRYAYEFLSSWMPLEGTEIFHRRERYFFSFYARFWVEDRRNKGVHDRRANCKSMFASFQARIMCNQSHLIPSSCHLAQYFHWFQRRG